MNRSSRRIALEHPTLIGADRGGIPNYRRTWARTGGPGSSPSSGSASCAHIDGARAGSDEIGAFEGVGIERIEFAGAEQGAAAEFAPGADDGGKTGDGADRHAAAAVALHAVVDADQGRSGRGVFEGELLDIGARDAGDAGDKLRRILLQGTLAQLIAAPRQYCDCGVIVVLQAVAPELMCIRPIARKRRRCTGRIRNSTNRSLSGQSCIYRDRC